MFGNGLRPPVPPVNFDDPIGSDVPYAMCDYTQVNYQCAHVRYTVKAWCVRYQKTHARCPPNVVAT